MIYNEELHWWLKDDFEGKSAIRFKNRIEFKKNGVYHNLTNSAIIYTDEKDDEYYINGVKYTIDEWKFKLRKRKLNSLLKKE